MESSDSWGRSCNVRYFEENRENIHYAFSLKIRIWHQFSRIYTGHIRMAQNDRGGIWQWKIKSMTKN